MGYATLTQPTVLSTEIPNEIDLSKGRLSLALKQLVNLTRAKRLSVEE